MAVLRKLSDYSNAKMHRDPKWPIGGYAPGDYANSCQKCGLHFIDMDKRAYECFPCAVENIVEANRLLAKDLREANAKIDTLKSAFAIVIEPDAAP